jgi:hypothetical protein
LCEEVALTVGGEKDMNRQTWARVVFALTICAFSAHAEIIYDNGASLSQGGLLSTVDTRWLASDNFVLEAGSTTLADIHWWGYYAEDVIPTDSFTAFIYSDSAGEPGTVLHTFTAPVVRTDTGDLTFGEFPEFEYHMDVDPVELTAGTTYWLAIQNDVDCNWFWSITEFETGDAHSKLQHWVNQEVDLAFHLTGPGPDSSIIPEPASLSLMGMGLVGFALRRKMTAKK